MSSLGAAEYLGHQLLLHHQEQRGLVPKTVFHKLWCISDRHLQDNYEVNIGLPRYWYKYGEMADEQSVNDEFYAAPSAPWGGQAYKPVWELEASDFDVTKEVRDLIDSTVKWTLNRFKKRHTQYLESYQYQAYSPNNFIRAYSELREHLQYTDLESQEVLTAHTFRPEFEVDSNEELIEAYLDELVITYPENDKDFASFQTLFLRWDDTARLLLKQENPYSRLDAFLDRFVEALSKVVLQSKYNSNIPEQQLKHWQERNDTIPEFEEYLDNYRDELLENRKMSGVLESVAETYDETVISDLEQNQ